MDAVIGCPFSCHQTATFLMADADEGLCDVRADLFAKENENQECNRNPILSKREISREFLSLFVDGVKDFITADILKAYFARFGEVLAVDLSRKSLTDEPGGCAYISLLLNGDPSQIDHTYHFVCGVSLHIKERYSFDLAESHSKVTHRDILPEHQLEVTQETSSSTINLVPQQQLKQKSKNQKRREKQQEHWECKRQKRKKWKFHLRKHHAVVRAQKAFDLYVEGVRYQISKEQLEGHFATFGEVIDVLMTRDVHQLGRSAFIAIRPTEDPTNILSRKHSIDGHEVNVTKCFYCRKEGNKSLRTEQDTVSETQLESSSQKESSTTTPYQNQAQKQSHIKQKAQLQDVDKPAKLTNQEGEELKKHWAFSQSENALELYVTGVELNITEGQLRAHFACFGEVLEVFMLMNYSNTNHRGSCYITLLQTGDPTKILETKHIVQGVNINVAKCVLFGDGQIEYVRTKQTKEELQKRRQIKTKRKLDFRNHQAIARAEKALDLYVNGVRSEITEEHLITHFASFGIVLDVHVVKNCSNNKPSGIAYIAIRPTVDPKQLRGMEHIINGVTIHVLRSTSFDNVGNKPVRTEGDLDSEPLHPKRPLRTSKKKALRPAKLVHQPLQQHKKERKGQANRETKKQEKIARQLQQLKQAQKQNQHRKQLQQHGLQEHRSVSRPQKSLQLFVSGTKEAIIPDIVKAYFARFGEVLDMNFPVDLSREQHCGSCYITLQPTANAVNIFDRQHFLRGSRITAVECYSPENAEIEGVGNAEGISSRKVDLEPLPTEKQLEIAKQNMPCPSEPVHEQQNLPKQHTYGLKHESPEKLHASCTDGVKGELAAEDSKTYFARFGAVPSVNVSMNPVTNEPSGYSSTKLRPTTMFPLFTLFNEYCR